jgi:hypothetical protein
LYRDRIGLYRSLPTSTPTALKIQAWLGIDVRDNTKGQSINSLPMLESGILGIPTVITVNSEATPYTNGVRKRGVG